MKLQWELARDIRLITSHGAGWVAIDGERFATNLIVTPTAVHPGWAPGGWATLDGAAIDQLLALEPELILLASGPQLSWPPKAALARLVSSGVGFEVMALAAACRTYNVVASEGRRVVAGLVLC